MYSVTTYNQALKLRKAGASYSRIKLKLGIPKSTLSTWFSKLDWSQVITKQLNEKHLAANRNRILQINSSKRLATINRHNAYRREAQDEFNKLLENPLFIFGLGLYWGEGEKAANGRVSLINSDTRMVKTIKHFYVRVLKIPTFRLRAGLFIYEDHCPTETLTYWSKALKLPRKQFIKIQTLPSRSKTDKKVRYGMCSLYFSSVELHIKMMEWIDLLAKHMRE
jgi:hypothetical protein